MGYVPFHALVTVYIREINFVNFADGRTFTKYHIAGKYGREKVWLICQT